MWFCYFLLSIGALQVQAAPGGDASVKITGTGTIGKDGKTSLNINVQIGGNGGLGRLLPKFPTEGGQYPQPTQGPITGTLQPEIPTSGPLTSGIPTGGATTGTPGGLGNIGGMGPKRRPGRPGRPKRPRRPGSPGLLGRLGRLFPRPRPKFPTKGGQYPQPTQGPITGTPPPGIPTSGPPTSGIPTGGATTGTPGGGTPGGPITGTPPPGVPTLGPPTGTPTGGATTGTPGGGAPGEFTEEEEIGLAKHNEFRQIHQAPPMTLDRLMCDQAKEYAERLLLNGTLKHSNKTEREGQGENLSMGCSTIAAQSTETAVINWYNEVCDPGYDFNNGGFSSGTGHFTQVVWKGSTVLGIGRAEGEMKGMKCAFIVGRYKPAGNMMGDFPKNVLKGSFNPNYCNTVESKRKRYFDENGKAVLINTPFTEVDIPTVRIGKVQHPPRPVFELLNSKKKKKNYVGSRHH